MAQDASRNVEVSQDVRFAKYSVGSPGGLTYVNMVLIDQDAVRSGRIAVEAALGGDHMGSCATPAGIAGRVGALAAINGPYFAGGGDRVYPIGFAALDGALASLGALRRAMVGIDSENEFRITVAHPQAFVTSDTYFEPLFLWGINQPAGADNVSFYDRKWGDSISPQGGIAVAVAPIQPGNQNVIVVGPDVTGHVDWDGSVIERSSSGSISIPEDGYVLVFRGDSLPDAERYQAGAKVCAYAYELPDGWESMRWIATLGPWFVHDGNRRDYSDETAYGSEVTSRANRSVIGTTWNNEIFFAVTTGAGLSVREAADVMVECNAREAVMCDSGSSSGMWAEGVGSIVGGQPIPLAFVVRELSSPPGDITPLKVWTGNIHR